MSTPSFAVNERVHCYYGPLINEAKVLKCEIWDETNTKLDTTMVLMGELLVPTIRMSWRDVRTPSSVIL